MATSPTRAMLRAAIDLLVFWFFLCLGVVAASGSTDVFRPEPVGPLLGAMVIIAWLLAAFALILAGQRILAASTARNLWLPQADWWLPFLLVAWFSVALLAARI